MSYYTVQMHDGELYHHGILGQKWGRRNGPPYPLGASDHSSAEKKAGWRKSLSKANSDYAKAEKDKFNKYRSTRNELLKDRKAIKQDSKEKLKANTKKLRDNRNEFEDNHVTDKYKSDLKNVAKEARNSINPETVKKVAKIGAAVAVTGLAAYGTYKITKSGIMAKGRSAERNAIRMMRKNPWIMDAVPGQTTTRTRGYKAGMRVNLQTTNYQRESLRESSASRYINESIRNGEQSALAIFDNLEGHNNMRTIANLIESGSQNRFASNGEWILEELRKK